MIVRGGKRGGRWRTCRKCRTSHTDRIASIWIKMSSTRLSRGETMLLSGAFCLLLTKLIVRVRPQFNNLKEHHLWGPPAICQWHEQYLPGPLVYCWSQVWAWGPITTARLLISGSFETNFTTFMMSSYIKTCKCLNWAFGSQESETVTCKLHNVKKHAFEEVTRIP